MKWRLGDNHHHNKGGKDHHKHIIGSQKGDVINGGSGRDHIFGRKGNDIIFGEEGDDWIRGGKGNDTVSGGDGNDILRGGGGNDVLNGGKGSDLVRGGHGDDILIFTDADRGGHDRYVGGKGQDGLVIEFAADRWADAAVKAEVLAFLDFLASGANGTFTFATMNLEVTGVETLTVKVDGQVIDPKAEETDGGGDTGGDPVAPAGEADTYSVSENGTLVVSPLANSGSLVDNDDTGNGAFTVELVTGPARGTLVLNADGTFEYAPGGAFDYLAAGQSAVETFTYQIVNSAGTSAPVTVSLNVTGNNDSASITGTLSGSVTEDNVDPVTGDLSVTASGQITVTDADAGQSTVGNAGTHLGTYGSLVLQANGSWEYTLDNNFPLVLALGEGDSVVDSFAVLSSDGTASDSIVINIAGSNDLPSFYGTLNGTVNEDGGAPEDEESGSQTASGNIIVYDDDAGDAGFINPGNVAGLYGTVDIADDGSWIYTLNNDLSEVQSLRAGERVVDVIDLTALDGTGFSLNIQIEGANDAAEFSGVLGDQIILAQGDTSADGFITVTDADHDESGVVAGTYTGTYGSLTLSEDGSWNYDFLAFDQLPQDEPVYFFENFDMATLGGDYFNIAVEILTNDPNAS